MIGGLGVGELSIILCIVVVLFGAGRLAGIGSGLGKGIRNFKKEIDPAEKKKLEEQAQQKTEEQTEEKTEDTDSAI